jgi:hypothetical protein
MTKPRITAAEITLGQCIRYQHSSTQRRALWVDSLREQNGRVIVSGRRAQVRNGVPLAQLAAASFSLKYDVDKIEVLVAARTVAA